MFRICEGETGNWMRKTARLRGDGAERARFDAKRGNAAKKARQRGMWAPFGIPQRLTLEMKLPWHYRVGAHPPDASLTCGWVRKNEEADSVQTDSLHSASRASRKAPHPLLRFSSQNRNDVSVLKGRAAKRTSPRVYTGTASEAARCAPFPRQARKLRICSRLLPDPPESLRWIPSEM